MDYQPTSREALRNFLPVASDAVDNKIINALWDDYLQKKKNGRLDIVGLTDFEIREATGLNHQTETGNRRHLYERHVVAKSGRRRKQPHNNNKAIVWVIAVKGTEILKELPVLPYKQALERAVRELGELLDDATVDGDWRDLVEAIRRRAEKRTRNP